MHLYKTNSGALLHIDNNYYLITEDWDELINVDDLHTTLNSKANSSSAIDENEARTLIAAQLLPPIGNQEVWAAGVTYLRSRDARMEESKESGAADCYSRVYEADRPELFFKSLAHRVSGHGQMVNIRKDSEWNVPEPELALFINSAGSIQAYTIGNDMSSRSIEGENPLYLPQAKVYDRSAALGPCLFVPGKPIAPETNIRMEIRRKEELQFEGHTPISRMKRGLEELAGFLYRECSFPNGAFLMTGTCLVPSNDFTLAAGDVVSIRIDNIGLLANTVAERDR